jgi:uncharacterized protein YdaU (DUF1376 family)
MDKPPAFLFYAREFLVGTQTFAVGDLGAYIRCLAYQWDAGAVPADAIDELAGVMICPPLEAAARWQAIRHKFVRRLDGRWVNLRLEREREKLATLARRGRAGGFGKARAREANA